MGHVFGCDIYKGIFCAGAQSDQTMELTSLGGKVRPITVAYFATAKNNLISVRCPLLTSSHGFVLPLLFSFNLLFLHCSSSAFFKFLILASKLYY